MWERGTKMIKNKDVKEIINICNNNGIELFLDENKLKFRTYGGVLSKEIRETLKLNKGRIINYLSDNSESQTDLFAPFPLTPVQSAYLLGRNASYIYGNTSCHIYQEFEYSRLDIDRVQSIWNNLIDRHDMLRARIYKEGYQKIQKNIKEYSVIEGDTDYIRKLLSNKIYALESDFMFDIGVSKKANNSILHFSMDFMIADWSSIWIILLEFEKLYFNPNSNLKKIEISFKDYIKNYSKKETSLEYKNSEKYWENKIKTIYEAPHIPLLKTKGQDNAEFIRLTVKLGFSEWLNFKKIARNFGVTPTAAILTLYSKVLEIWSETKGISINLTMFGKEKTKEDSRSLVGDFTNTSIISTTCEKKTYIDCVREINKEIFLNIDHRYYSGVEVLRTINRKRKERDFILPYVFTSAIGLIKEEMIGIYEYGVSQTPQVLIDCQAMDNEEGLFINWDVRKSMFPIDMLNEMFSEFKEALNNLAILEANWNRIDFVPIKFEKIDRYKRSTTPNLKPTINGNDKSENDDKIEFYHKENEDIDDLDKTEILVHDICLIELKVKNIRKNRSLYEYNADSLTMAKIASKIRNKTNIPFEEILKTLLFEPTIENIAHFIKKYKENMDERESFQEQAEGSKFIYTKTYEDINNPYENKARIFIYGPFGNGEMYEDLANLLASQCQGKVLTMGIYNIDKFLEMDSERVVPYFSEECFKELNKTNIDSVQIIGYCFGGVVAMELTRLFLKKGINVMDFTIIEGGSAKEIKYDDLLLEIMFLQAFDVTLFDLGIKQTDLMEGIYNNADVTEVTLSDLISKLSNKNDINTLKSLQKEEQEERFDLYSNLINSKEHKKELSKSSLLESFKIYKTSLKAQNYQPDIFLRDFNYVIAKDNTGTYKNFDKILDNWTEILMGEINKKYTSGNHYSCVENNDHIPKLASLLAIPELAIRG